MILHKSAREYYTLEITTTPAVSGPWEASFDGGTTWVAGTAATLGDVPVTRWLIAGAAAEQGAAVAVIAESVTPLIRATETPELVVDDAPRIQVR